MFSGDTNSKPVNDLFGGKLVLSGFYGIVSQSLSETTKKG